MKRHARLIKTVVFAFSLVLFAAVAYAQEPGQKTFATPQDAGNALYAAVKSGDKPGMEAVLGQSSASIISSGDEVQDKSNGEFFTQGFEQMNRWAKEIKGSQILYIGARNWPFPIPLKNNAGRWYFDTKAGAQEILFRRIGKNEMAAIRVCGVLADAQHDYFEQTHDGDSAHQYAQKFISAEGKQNGLYWKVAEGQPESPIGSLVAYAAGEGYGGKHDTPQPFRGYYYRTLTGQGANAKGGAKSYIVDGKMTGGFAFVAYPAEYRNSGVMTFLVDATGVVYQKDLGANTADVAKQMKDYNPNPTWVVATSGDEEQTSDSSNE
ncbi:MAG TPA: DUF2950 domain-containing protein [Terriglobales bacterium]|jgi:hypothetical protein